ncbi:TonB-dependent receptor [Pontibacter qinzhouensis]|uniref:TonB-dependent receptor n=1 Tax=Pontibacter qinzhouensis TaxID=2603253 RepID=A0A5C8JHI9_9BACT|nr:SusC/RagA family TonB-linked outer membrane protein [Pontibacter qinzhouensis]TXK36526.1 TonB-dependent receptor [Pontibacter qinzhouensis]
MKKISYYKLRSRVGKAVAFMVLQLAMVFGALAAETDTPLLNLQQTKVSLSFTNASLQDFIIKVESVTAFKFTFDEKEVLDKGQITLKVRNTSLDKVLQQVATSTGLEFKQINNNIHIRLPKPKEAQSLETIREKASPAQQQFSVQGKVTDERGEGLPGVTVLLKGTSTAAPTDIDGSYSFSIPNGNSTLVFSFVGYLSQEVLVNNRSTINVAMETDAKALDEVVVVGYGTQKRAEVTSAVTSVKSENFVKGAVKDAGQLLQGKVAGLSISTPTGDPTAATQIMLRGTATLASSTQPLVLIDGIPGDLNTVAPEDIESIDVLKDGSAAAIYGTRGTNGVILVTTKRPTGDIAPTIDYNGYVSTQSFVNQPRMLNASEYREKIGQGTAFQDQGTNTDWIKEVSRDLPVSHVHNLTYRGGNAQTNYLATLNYRYFEGVFLKSDNRTINGRVDINHNMFDNKLKVNVNMINTDNRFSSIGDGVSFDNTIYRQALIRNPTAPVQNPNGSWHEQTGIASYENPLALLYESDGQNQSQTNRLSGSVTWLPVEGLQLRAMGSRNRYNMTYGYFETKNNISTIRDGFEGLAIKQNAQNIDQLLELTAEYGKIVNNHRFTALGGYSYQDFASESSSLRNWDFPAGDFSYVDNIGTGNALRTGNAVAASNRTAANLIGFFGRLTYNYKEKYLLTANLRYEASSTLVGTEEPWGWFPAVSAGWRISDESFMSGLGFLDDLKIRAGFGITGTVPSALFLGVSRLGYNSGSFLINGEWVNNLSPVSNPNPYLKWERKKESNTGIDFSIFKGKVSGSIDYYVRRTDGLLYDYQVPSPPNLFGTTKANVGIMENKGFEVLLNFVPIQTSKFVWNSSLNFSNNTNKLVSLSNDLYEVTNDFFNEGHTGSPVQTYTHRVQVGQPIGNFYGYKVIDISDDGRWIYEDRDGNPSNTKVEADKKILGNGLPQYYAGWNNNFRYGNLDLSVTMRGAFDYQILNFQRMYYENPGVTEYNQLQSAYEPVFGKTPLNRTVPLEYNSYYIENGDFWKIDNVTLGYSLPVANSKHFKQARLYVSTLNTFTFTGYKGMDPEVNRIGLSPGNDMRDKYPSTRVYTVGVNISFN